MPTSSTWSGRPSACGTGLERQRPFGTKKPVDTELVEALARNGDLSPAEVLRQREEDADLSAFAAEGTAAATTEPDLDSLAADLDALRQEDRAQHAPAEPNSRSSSPIEYEEYEEPERWADNLLVVQDPFILTRNCPGNVAPDWVEELRIVRPFQVLPSQSLAPSADRRPLNFPLHSKCAVPAT
jgi:hypothetical protein